uniref:non-specific serine/threonine protein kinase n=1 Tax=Gongylonema pulchrum TaxID=637853 RepID=A0A183EUK8_9BILA
LTMPAPKKKLHELAAVVPEKTVITDSRKQRFIVGKEFARGGFGRIYTAKQEDSREYGKDGSLALKIEPHGNGPLFTEITVFQRILMPEKLTEWSKQNKVSHVGLPPYISSGLYTHNGEKLRFLIMPRYEKSLETYRTSNGGTLDMHVVLSVAKQCINCLSYMQDHDYVHGDLKADNILLASANAFSKCFLVDFGLAKMAKGNVEKPDKKRAHNGTLLFTSLDAHRGCAPSYR